MKTIGLKDKIILRNEAGFATFPCKHLFRCWEIIPAAAGTIHDENGGVAIDGTTIIAADGTIAAAVDLSISAGSFYIPADTDDLIIVQGGNAAGSIGKFYYANGLTVNGMQIGDTNGGGFVVGNTFVSNPGVGFLTSEFTGFTAAVWKRQTGVFRIFSVDGPNDDIVTPTYVGTTTPYSYSAVTGVWKAAHVLAVHTGNGFGLYAFENGSLPDDSILLPALSIMAKNWAVLNRISPDGWGQYY